MQSEREDRLAARREILDLLRERMESLDSPLGLTDEQLKQCYHRQARVQELREKPGRMQVRRRCRVIG
jgi:hypothetical protein